MKDCIFCDIISKNRDIIHQDDIFVVFKDKYPASDFHFLMIPKIHIESIRDLRKSDIDILLKMKDLSQIILDKYQIKDYQIGFHRSYFVSINHLHLHILGKPFNSFWKSLLFKRLSFITIDQILETFK